MTSRNKRFDPNDPLDAILQAVDAQALREFIRSLAASDVAIRRQSIDYLKSIVPLSAAQEMAAEGALVLALWRDLEPDLSEMNDFGGADDAIVSHVDGLLYELTEKLKAGKAPRDVRRELLREALHYIRRGNAGMDDALYNAAYALCYDEDDWRELAEGLIAVGKDWPVGCARDIYRKIGDRDNYLALRLSDMTTGSDYFDLASFYWERGEKEQALAVGREGLAKNYGRMTELREFMAERAMEAGDRTGFLGLHFREATDRLTAESYRAFQALCTPEEWTEYEPKVLALLPTACENERIKIHLFRGEHAQAAEVLSQIRTLEYIGGDIMTAAKQLEATHPEKVLGFYLTGLGKLDRPTPRKVYAAKARMLEHIRRVLVDALNAPDRWQRFSREIRAKTARWPAFHEEVQKRIPDWHRA